MLGATVYLRRNESDSNFAITQEAMHFVGQKNVLQRYIIIGNVQLIVP